jgi:molybdenum cofactor cytidylyltransferase
VIAAVILAAGASRRMGRPKLTLPWGGGETIIEHVVGVYRRAGAEPIVIVSAANDPGMTEALARLQVVSVHVPPGDQMLASVKAGLSALKDPEIEATLLSPGDHPMIAEGTVRQLLDSWRAESSPILAPSLEGHRGHPVLVERSLWPAIQSLGEDRTLRDFLRSREDEIRYIVVDDRGVIRDIDTPQDYDQALADIDPP